MTRTPFVLWLKTKKEKKKDVRKKEIKSENKEKFTHRHRLGGLESRQHKP